MTPAVAKQLLTTEPGLRIVPVVLYRPAVFRAEIHKTSRAAAGRTAVRTTFTVKSKNGGAPVPHAEVVAFTDFQTEEGDQGVTNAHGVVRLRLGSASKIERLYVYPEVGFWGSLQKNVRADGDVEIELTPVDLAFEDVLRHFYGSASLDAGHGVTVAVIDTGVGPHPDLVVSGGKNTVVGERTNDFKNNGDGHGTHVAGIIAARGTPPNGIRGVAPGVTLRSYRVYGKNKDEAKNYAIIKAIDEAVSDNCDIINLSLGGDYDPAVISAIQDARQKGSVVVAATGNDGRQPVSYPASDPLCIAVTALGRKGTFPRGTDCDGDVKSPFGTDAANFIAGFSNVGPQVDLCGPGEGVLSTVPGGYAPMSGTSMASPAVAGIAARLLAQDARIRSMSRNQQRSDAIIAMILRSAKDLGFQARFEGAGIPLP
jgi:subtilisin